MVRESPRRSPERLEPRKRELRNESVKYARGAKRGNAWKLSIGRAVRRGRIWQECRRRIQFGEVSAATIRRQQTQSWSKDAPAVGSRASVSPIKVVLSISEGWSPVVGETRRVCLHPLVIRRTTDRRLSLRLNSGDNLTISLPISRSQLTRTSWESQKSFVSRKGRENSSLPRHTHDFVNAVDFSYFFIIYQMGELCEDCWYVNKI